MKEMFESEDFGVFLVVVVCAVLVVAVFAMVWGLDWILTRALTSLRKQNRPPMNSKAKMRILVSALVVFILTCLFPPWQFTGGRYGNHEPAGYSLIFIPPSNPYRGFLGLQIDFGQLLIEWAALAAITGLLWIFFVKPPWLHDGKTNRLQKFVPPPGNPEN